MFNKHLGRSALAALAAVLLAQPAASAPSPTPSPPAAPAGAPAAKVSTATSPEGYTYGAAFPTEIGGLGFAMPKQAFLDVLAAKKLTPVTNTAKSQFLIQPPGAPYNSAVYFFDSNAGPILTELELRFADEARARAYFNAKFPPATRRGPDGEYWYNDGVLTYSVRSWTFGTKVYIVATMLNTRWVGVGRG